jgi:hypothetical protein
MQIPRSLFVLQGGFFLGGLALIIMNNLSGIRFTDVPDSIDVRGEIRLIANRPIADGFEVELSEEDGDQVQLAARSTGKALVITPTYALTSGQTYRVKVAGFRDRFGSTPRTVELSLATSEARYIGRAENGSLYRVSPQTKQRELVVDAPIKSYAIQPQTGVIIATEQDGTRSRLHRITENGHQRVIRDWEYRTYKDLQFCNGGTTLIAERIIWSTEGVAEQSYVRFELDAKGQLSEPEQLFADISILPLEFFCSSTSSLFAYREGAVWLSSLDAPDQRELLGSWEQLLGFTPSDEAVIVARAGALEDGAVRTLVELGFSGGERVLTPDAEDAEWWSGVQTPFASWVTTTGEYDLDYRRNADVLVGKFVGGRLETARIERDHRTGLYEYPTLSPDGRFLVVGYIPDTADRFVAGRQDPLPSFIHTFELAEDGSLGTREISTERLDLIQWHW